MTPHQKRTQARNLARAALAKGEIQSQPCESCGGLPVDMHHVDYSRPLDVRFLCRRCHQKAHQGDRRRRGPHVIVRRPTIPEDIWRAALRAGAPLNLDPREFILLAVRDGLRRFGELPDAFALSVDELAWIEEATR